MTDTNKPSSNKQASEQKMIDAETINSETINSETIAALTKILEQRKDADPTSSYVASLYHKGLDAILKKVGEEATETVMAAKDVSYGGDKEKLVYEIADLWFHTMVLLADQGLSADDVLQELARRFGVSGHDEKASRS